MLASKVTAKFQTTIPADVRKRLGINQGDWVAFEFEGDKVVLPKLEALIGTVSSQNDGGDGSGGDAAV